GTNRVKTIEIELRIAQSVRMIDANAVEDAVQQPLENPHVSVGKDALILGAQAHQCIDVEKTPVTELLLGGAPESQAIVLSLEQEVKLIDVRIDFRDARIDGSGDFGLFATEMKQLTAKNRFVAVLATHG